MMTNDDGQAAAAMLEDILDSQNSPEVPAALRKEVDDPCEMCKCKRSKYSCPACYTRTCSLPCVQLHKTRFGCDGVAKRTKMVTLDRFDALTLLNDYRFLEEATRLAAKNAAFLNEARKDKRDFKKSRSLVFECKRRGIRLELSPWGMQKSTTNTSAYNPVAETIFWRIEWIFVDAGNFTIQIDKNPESVKVDTLLRQFIKARHGCEMLIPKFTEDRRFARYHVPRNVDDVPWSCYTKCDRNGWTKDTRYYNLDNKKTICENLAGKVLVEFPTIYVAGSHLAEAEDSRFPLLTEGTRQSVLQKRIWERNPVSRTLKEQFRLMDDAETPAARSKWKAHQGSKVPVPNYRPNDTRVSKSEDQDSPKPQLPRQESQGAAASLKTDAVPSKPQAPMRPLRRLLRPNHSRDPPVLPKQASNQKKPSWNPFAAKRAGKRQAIEDLAVALSAEKEEEQARATKTERPVEPIDRRYPDVFVEEKEKTEKRKTNDYFSLLGFHYASSNDSDSDLEEGEIRTMADSKSKTVAAEAPFSVLCKLLDSICNAGKPEKRRALLKGYIDFWRKKHAEVHGTQKTDDSFYPAMRLILPGFDKERGPYGFKEHMLAKKLTDILVMNKQGEDAQRLLNYRAPHHAKGAGDVTGDFAAVASEVLRHRVSKSVASLSLEEVNRRLDAIALANASKDKAAMDRELEWLCRSVNEVELKWLIRILLKQMKIGMQENSALVTFHPEAGQLYDVTTSLQRVCQQLHDPTTRLDVVQIQLFTPFRPMLANRSAPEKVVQIAGERPFYVEEKYDGERVQLHKRNDEYKYYSRNANEFTSSYGASSKEGSFTPYIHEAFKNSIRNCILDGEMVGWNPEAKCVATKGEQFDVRSLKDGDDIHPCFVAFDCLLINDEVLTLKPLEERIQRLRECFEEVEGRFICAKRELKSTTQDVVDAMNWAIERREEGIVIKRPDSAYRLNVRSNEGGWLKIKPDYLDAVNDDFDLLIIGGYFGEGRRRNLMSHFLLGLAVPSDPPGERPKKFISVAKVGSGYTMKELYDLNVYLNTKPLRKTIPQWYEVGSERPDYYIDPESSKIVQVRAADIHISKQFAAGHTFRFPRVQKIRDDKSWYDAMTVDQFHKLRTESEGKLAQKYELKTDGPSPAKKRCGAARHAVAAARPALGSQFLAADVKHVKKTSDVFKGKEFCIIGGCGEFTKQDLEKKVAEFGGKITQHPRAETFCVVADRKIVKVQNIVQAKLTNVVKAPWLVEFSGRYRGAGVIEVGFGLPGCQKEMKPSGMWFSTPAVERAFASDFDEFGDSYTQPVTVESLRSILEGAKPNLNTQPLEQRDELVMEYFSDYEYALFRRCRAFFDNFHILGDGSTKILNSPLDLSAAEYQLYGGRTAKSLDECTHVVMHSKNLIHLTQLNELNRSKSKKFHIVTEQWINDCILGKRLKDEVDYRPLPSVH